MDDIWTLAFYERDSNVLSAKLCSPKHRVTMPNNYDVHAILEIKFIQYKQRASNFKHRFVFYRLLCRHFTIWASFHSRIMTKQAPKTFDSEHYISGCWMWTIVFSAMTHPLEHHAFEFRKMYHNTTQSPKREEDESHKWTI